MTFLSRPCLAFPPPTVPLPIPKERERERKKEERERESTKERLLQVPGQFEQRVLVSNKVTHLWPTILLAYSLNTALLPLL